MVHKIILILEIKIEDSNNKEEVIMRIYSNNTNSNELINFFNITKIKI